MIESREASAPRLCLHHATLGPRIRVARSGPLGAWAMLVDRFKQWKRLRWAWVVLTILGLCRIPMPWPDYHVLGHQHEPGQLCTHHEHLLSWHPSVEVGDRVPIMHWHWAPLRPASQGDRPTERDSDLLSTVPEEVALLPEFGPALSPDASKRWQGPHSIDCVGPIARPFPPRAWPGTSRPMGLAPPSRASDLPSSSLLQRWIC